MLEWIFILFFKLFLRIIFIKPNSPSFQEEKARPTPSDHGKIQDPPLETSDPSLTIINERSLNDNAMFYKTLIEKK